MPFVPVRPHRDDPALLYSLAEFAEIIFSCFEAARVSTIVEIGAEAGLFTEALIAWVSDHGGHLTSIDPAPSEGARDLLSSCQEATLEVASSVEVLPRLAPSDAYLIDGDHNYHTVRRELELISSHHEPATHPPLIVVQDLSWPSGQRDQYYDPASLAEEARHPYAFGGVVPWADDVGVRGFRGAGRFAFACHEGGPRNGVGTAITDFLAEHPDYAMMVVPCIFGLAVIYPLVAPWAEEVVGRVGPFDDHPLLRRLEGNRLWLYLRVIELEDLLSTVTLEAAGRADEAVNTADRLRRELGIAHQELSLARSECNRLESELAASRLAPDLPATTARRRRHGRRPLIAAWSWLTGNKILRHPTG
ncbi:MAG: class I SAM-dependent methyltransferase [Acidimicrobiales bacterium]